VSTQTFFQPAPAGAHIDLGWILLGLLKIPSYQRPEPDDRVARLTENWEMIRCGSLIVSKRGSTLFLVDGQTRVSAARRRGLDRLPSIVLFGLTEKEEAGVFLSLNRDRLAVNALSRHKAEVIHGDPRAVAIDHVLRENCLYAWRTAPAGFTPFTAIAKAELVYNDGGPELLTRVLMLLSLAFPEDSGRFQGHYVAGLGFFLARDTWGADDERVLRTLSKITAAKLDEAAHHWKQLSGVTSNANPLHMAKAIASKVYRNRTDWKPGKPGDDADEQ
jgi:hypothetical protein